MRDSYVYPAVLTVAADGVSVEFPDLPGCLTCGATVEEAIAMAKEVLALHLRGLKEDGDPIPEPTSIAQLATAPGQIPVLVEVKAVPLPAPWQ